MDNVYETRLTDQEISSFPTIRKERKLILKKIDPVRVSCQISNIFENSKNYLNTDDDIIIGKRIETNNYCN